MIVILMGVSGSGKTTVGHALAERLGWSFAEGDDFHSAANRAKMHAGIPLTDLDREPWLNAIHAQIELWLQNKANMVLACSALKQSYRDQLIAATPAKSICFVYLQGSASLIQQRLQQRHGHYMPASLLGSQFEALEPPQDAIVISVAPSVPVIVEQILTALHNQGYAEESTAH